MRNFRVLTYFLLAFLIAQTTQAQKLSQFPHGIGLEILSGHNSFDWDLKVYNLSRNQSNVTLNGKLFYRFQTIGSFYLEPFIGYTQFGGKSPQEPNGYQDKLELKSIDLGGLCLYNTGLFNIDVGLGLKAKYLLSATWHQYGKINDSPSDPKSWVEEDAMEVFTKISYNAGLRISTSFQQYRFGIEYWMGISDLKDDDYFGEDETGSITENHYRFTFGIMF